MGKISIIREQGTDYLCAGFLQRELEKHEVEFEATINVEPKKGEITFCQDYLSYNDSSFVFYALPSQRKDHVEKMGKNTALVTYAADPGFHKPQEVDKKYEVGFVGRMYYPSRKELVDCVGANFSLGRWEELPGTEIPVKLSQCKILLNHTRPEIDVNLRFFETMALGCQVMLRTPALEEFAKEGVHYFGYSSPEECVEVIHMLLKDEDLRMRTITNARSHFLANHTYAHRAQAIINHLTEFYEDPRNRG
jgi:hypothetical protein